MNATAQAVAVASAAPLRVRGLTHHYESKIVLDHVDLALQPWVRRARCHCCAYSRDVRSATWSRPASPVSRSC